MGDDSLGARYEDRLSPDRRSALGAFYTPPAIAAAICEWAVQPVGAGDPGDAGVPRVLDPAAGSGRFLLAAHDRIQRAVPAATAGQIADSLVAVDVDEVSLDIAARNLAERAGDGSEGSADDLHTVAASFFDLAPPDGRDRDDDAPPDGRDRDDDAPPDRRDRDDDPPPNWRDGDDRHRIGRFDAVVGNPPYLRQEALSTDRDHFRRHLRAFGPAGTTPYYDGDRRLSTKADAYVYFVTHGLQFLRDGGRLGYVVPAKWLDTRYGEDLQTFLYDHARLEAVVGFSARAFDALVDTVLLFVERCTDAEERARTVTDFVRLEEPVDPGTLAGIVADDQEAPAHRSVAVATGDAYRTVSVPQRRLAERGGGKLGYYLTAPAPFVALAACDRMVPLGTYADVSFGHKTGNNAFFLLDGDDAARWNLPDEFLCPAVRSLRDIETRRLEETDRYLLDLHDYVEAVAARRGELTSETAAATVKQALRDDGHDAVLEYIRHGEAEGVPDGQTVARRTPWFDLGDLPAPEVLHPVFYDERVFTVENAGSFAPTNAIQRVDVTEYEAVVPHLLNSTLHKVMLELWGRNEGGGALQLLTYEVASVPIPDPAGASPDERAAVHRAGERLLDGAERAQDELDSAVLAALDIELSAGELQTAHDAMVRRRLEEAAEQSVQVHDTDDFDGADPDSLAPECDEQEAEQRGFDDC
ncbi:MAG: Eco57I restriction-modification methylase domain-containing protein [Haloglomus sp.]